MGPGRLSAARTRGARGKQVAQRRFGGRRALLPAASRLVIEDEVVQAVVPVDDGHLRGALGGVRAEERCGGKGGRGRAVGRSCLRRREGDPAPASV